WPRTRTGCSCAACPGCRACADPAARAANRTAPARSTGWGSSAAYRSWRRGLSWRRRRGRPKGRRCLADRSMGGNAAKGRRRACLPLRPPPSMAADVTKEGTPAMPIDYPQVLERRTEGEGAWTNQDAMLYAIGVGMGADPMDERELAFVYERNLKALPSFASVVRSRPVTSTGPEARMQLNPVLIVDGERNITFHKPMPAAAKIKTRQRTLGVYDKGKDKGAVVVNETVMTDEAGDPIATIHASIFARGDGGFGGPTDGQPEPHPVPTREPDQSVDIVTLPSQALIYRLSGDYNPLHAD